VIGNSVSSAAKWPKVAERLVTFCALASVTVAGSALFSPMAKARDMAGPLVRLSQGQLRGKTGGGIRSFLGIPFAQPPVAALRWRPPLAAKPWTGVRDATLFGNDCMQPPSILSRLSKAPGLSEDCLTLNVWAPEAKGNARLPVMVWIYGGSFLGGSASAFDGSALARKGVIVVAANYRTGIFGFLANAQLSAESDKKSSGNYGLLDQLETLRWIRRNIAAFGGDPGSVTVFGESAGASAVSLLLTSPLAHGLFERAILESPGAMRPMLRLPEAEAAARAQVGDITALRAMPAKEVLALQSGLVPVERNLSRPRILSPIVDGWVVPTDDRAAYVSGRVARVPIIIGGNADEGRLFTQSWPIKTIDQFRDYVRESFGDRTPQIMALYAPTKDADVPSRLSELFADTQFNMGYDGIADAMSTLNVPTFRYRFTRQIRGLAPTHGAELPFVFGDMANPEWTAADREMSNTMMDAWVRFARTGNPNSNAVPWQRYSRTGRTYLEFGDVVHSGTLARSARINYLWQSSAAARR